MALLASDDADRPSQFEPVTSRASRSQPMTSSTASHKPQKTAARTCPARYPRTTARPPSSSAGTASTQWCVHEIGEMSRPVTAQKQNPSASFPRRPATQARNSPVTATRQATSSHTAVTSAVCMVRASTPSRLSFSGSCTGLMCPGLANWPPQYQRDGPGSTANPTSTVTPNVTVAVAAARYRRVRSRYTMKIPGVSLIPVATPIAAPGKSPGRNLGERTAPARSYSTSNASSRSICPYPSVVRTGSSQAAATPASSAISQAARELRAGQPSGSRSARYSTSGSAATLAAASSAALTGNGTAAGPANTTAANGG